MGDDADEAHVGWPPLSRRGPFPFTAKIQRRVPKRPTNAFRVRDSCWRWSVSKPGSKQASPEERTAPASAAQARVADFAHRHRIDALTRDFAVSAVSPAEPVREITPEILHSACLDRR